MYLGYFSKNSLTKDMQPKPRIQTVTIKSTAVSCKVFFDLVGLM
jgi:hypothetical protein